MAAILQDFDYALRTLVKRPAYAIATILVFALAIGANTTVLSQDFRLGILGTLSIHQLVFSAPPNLAHLSLPAEAASRTRGCILLGVQQPQHRIQLVDGGTLPCNAGT